VALTCRGMLDRPGRQHVSITLLYLYCDVLTRPNLVVSAETAANGVSAGSGASMNDKLFFPTSVRGTGLCPEKVVRLVFAIVRFGSTQFVMDFNVFVVWRWSYPRCARC